MNAFDHALASPRRRRIVFVASLLLLVAGVIAFLVAYYGNTGKSLDAPLTNKPAQVVKPSKSVPLEPAARKVAGEFILTAVRRQNLTRAYALAGPEIKQGMTLAEWKTGNIAVVPFLAPIDTAHLKVDYSYKRQAQFQVALLPKGKAKPQIFVVQLKKYGTGAKGRWLVDQWTPFAAVQIPVTPG